MFIYLINLRFLLALSGDIELNPGPECPCGVNKDRRNVLFISCSSCNVSWHTNCIGLNELTKNTLEALKSWKCPLCISLPSSVKESLLKKLCPDTTSILQKITDMEKELHEKIDVVIKTQADSKPKYSSVTNQNLENKVNDTNRLVKSIARSKQPVMTEEEKKLRNARTIIVRQYKDPKVRESKDIKRVLYQNYPGEVIREARTTAGGSLLIELEDEESADRILENWQNTLYGGNSGAVKIKIDPQAGLLKHVYQDEYTTEEEIIEEVRKTYPNSQIELFKNKKEEFTGTIKIGFKTTEELDQALKRRTIIFDQRYIMEKYINQPRVIVCRYCQVIGHVERICRAKFRNKHVCGKCTSTDHETKDCNVPESSYKCYHCGDNHETGNKKCAVMKQKLEEISLRKHNG